MSYRQITTATAVRFEEKEDMQKLNDKLALYVQRIRQLGLNVADSATFLASLQSVEDEVRKLKMMYEAELSSLRQQVDAANREKNTGGAECETMRRAASELEDRYRMEAGKNNQYMSDIQQLQQRIAALEHELASARAAEHVPQAQLVAAQNDLAKAEAKNQALAAGIEMERARVKQLQDTICSLEQKLAFGDQVHGEQLKDTQGRLEQSKLVISGLEARVVELESQNATLPEMMEKMRIKMEQELKAYKVEAEAAMCRDTAAVKQQLANQQRDLDQWKLMNGQLQTDNDNLMAKVRTLEGHIKDLNSQKVALEDQIKLERAKGAEQIRIFEKKLKELQDLLLARMAEMNANRDIQVSLRAEIEAMRVLLEEEERRLGGSVSRISVTSTPVRVEYGITSRSGQVTPARVEYGISARSGLNHSQVGSANLRMKAADEKAGGQSVNQNLLCGSYTEYQDSYNRPGHFRYSTGSGDTNTLYKSLLKGGSGWSAGKDGFPAMTTDNTCKGGWTTGSTKFYMNATGDIRGSGKYANSQHIVRI